MFSEMAEQWIRKNLSSIESPSVARKGVPSADSDAWMPDFVTWALERCALREDYEDSQSVGSLLIDFREWCIERDAVPADRQVFEALLADAGIPIRDVLAIGIILKTDLERLELAGGYPMIPKEEEKTIYGIQQ